MSYLLLAVVFYTVVKFSTDVWLHLRYEQADNNRRYELEEEVRELNKKIAELE